MPSMGVNVLIVVIPVNHLTEKDMKVLPTQRDFTWQQCLDITRIVWTGAHDGFIEFMAQFFYDHGYSALTDKYIDSEDAEKISEYLKTKPLN